MLPAPKKHLRRISAGWRYPRGAGHFAYDYPMPIGTPIYAVQAGVILDCNDGVRNQRSGHPAGSGAPSNWILLGIRLNGKAATVYYQHLNKGLKVKKGQRVRAGQQIAKSGNSGNTTGPHLHISSMWGTHRRASRYAYMRNGGRNKAIIFAPSKTYPSPKPAAKKPAAKTVPGRPKLPSYPGGSRLVVGSESEAVKVVQVSLNRKVTGVMSRLDMVAVASYRARHRSLWPAKQWVGGGTWLGLVTSPRVKARYRP